MAEEISMDSVAEYLKIPYGQYDYTPMETIVDAVNAMVTEWHGDTWPPGVKLGATMLAARLYRRRNSPSGVENFSDMGATYISRFDSDLERQLRIGKWTQPAVG